MLIWKEWEVVKFRKSCIIGKIHKRYRGLFLLGVIPLFLFVIKKEDK